MEIDWKKKYNEALEKIKRYTTDKYGCTRLKPADIFPELSNDEERMKKAIIDALNSHNNSINLLSSRGYSMDDVISYLEKKERQEVNCDFYNKELSDTVEDERIRNEILEYFLITRIKDFVANPERRKWISYIEKQKESIKEVEPITDGLNTEFQKQVSYLIASSINKEHEYSEGYVKWVSQSLLEYAKKESVKGSDEDERIRKAISCLVKDMPDSYGFAFGISKSDMLAYLEKQKESGIRWYKSDNRNNPKKPYIDKAGMFYTTDGRMCYASEIEKQEEQKPVEKQDYSGLTDLERAIFRGFLVAGVENVPIEIIKDIAKDCLAQSKQEWSEEDEYRFKLLMAMCEDSQNKSLTISTTYREMQETEDWLKNRFKSLCPQPKQEWNEEDKEILRAFKFICKKLIENPSGEKFSVDPPYAEKMLKFLESLSPDSKQEPICSWKPSKEQIRVFFKATPVNLMPKELAIYQSLYEDLEKLM